MEMTDVTGTPRPERDVEEALRFVENEMMRRPMALGADGSPMLIHFTVIRDVLRDDLRRRSSHGRGKP